MGRDEQFTIPAAVLRGFDAGDDATREWLSTVPSVAHDLLRTWGLRPEGEVRSGEAGIVVPVHRADGTPAALKLQVPRAETRAAILGLTRWDGRGVVRLLDSDADRGGMLIERLHADRSLDVVEDDDDAVRVIGGLLARLHGVPAPDGLPRLGTIVAGMIDDAPEAMRILDSADRARLDRWVRTVDEVGAEPGDRLLHWDLHYGNVLAADREPWLAIDPEPLVGDPGFDLWPALDSGWSVDPADADAPRIVRRRFEILTEMLDLDRDRAAVWTRARLLQNTLWDVEDGYTAIAASAKTVDDALASFVAVG
ncbi:aminoglycoside phosphotransferase family protein [Microbacterium sp. MYb62]|uniref:aminoglycoside phosphotransferase family protein n=1 Tax=Microbacterium sp. MYb62 TaxID=1848690 RepID=UPI000CFDB2DD|nr:aminoglycoside phosphotransferase family protein [Microbacterium sp. MYb62]PRB14122.1 hydroxyurea phosphotransferase [Microbacterium sp. MYb62]